MSADCSTGYPRNPIVARSFSLSCSCWSLYVGTRSSQLSGVIIELHLLLSMITPLSWLERVPTYKDQQEQLKEKDLATYGFLGYPLLQSADILLYRPTFVPVGEDQVAHVEITREIARRFNHLYGREPDFEQKAERAIKELGGRNTTLYRQLRRRFQESGDPAAIERARALVESNTRIT